MYLVHVLFMVLNYMKLKKIINYPLLSGNLNQGNTQQSKRKFEIILKTSFLFIDGNLSLD